MVITQKHIQPKWVSIIEKSNANHTVAWLERLLLIDRTKEKFDIRKALNIYLAIEIRQRYSKQQQSDKHIKKHLIINRFSKQADIFA